MTICFLASCTQTDPSFGGKIPIKQVEEESSRPVAVMYQQAGDRWIAVLWSIEKIDKEYQLEKDSEKLEKFRLGLISEKELIQSENRVGCLGLKELHVKEANRILGVQQYTLDDRKDRRKSFDIFTVYNSVHNPRFESVKAIGLLRPEADFSYKSNFLLELASFIKF
jgi:hypothetical protein